jgi:hypothetical protein
MNQRAALASFRFRARDGSRSLPTPTGIYAGSILLRNAGGPAWPGLVAFAGGVSMQRCALVCLLLAGCPDRTIAKLPPGDNGEIQKDLTLSIDIDILFVIDNSPSTRDKQALFAANFPRFVDALDRFPGGRPNLHIGVVSTTVDVGVDGFIGCHPTPADDGRLHAAPSSVGCSTPTDRYVVDVATPTGRQINYGTATLAETFSCIAQLGSGGCGFEAPLEAMKRALDGSRPENAGFLRPGAFLAVVILTDEDDCSTKDSTLFTLPKAKVGNNDLRCQPVYAYYCDPPMRTSKIPPPTTSSFRRSSRPAGHSSR